MCITGNRAGKTSLGLEILKWRATHLGNSTNCGIVMGQDYKALFRNIILPILTTWGDLIVKYDPTFHMLYLANGHIIYFISAESLKTIEGLSNAAYAWIDEVTEVAELGFKAIMTRLTDLDGPLFLTGTPIPGDGVAWAEELYKKGFNPDFCGDDVPYSERIISHSWSSYDNPYMSERALNRLSRSLTQKEAQVRLYGKFENIGDRVFEGSMLVSSWCGYQYSEIDGIDMYHYMLIDTASGQKENERGDETAIVIVGVAEEYGIYGKECISGLFTVDQIEKIAIAKCRQYQIHKVGVEAIAAQINYFLNGIRKAQTLQDAVVFVPLKRVGGKDRKPARHAGLDPYIRNKRLKFPVNEYGEWMHGFDKMIEQMRDTPYGRRDDCIDALADVVHPDLRILDGMRRDSGVEVEKKNAGMLATKEDYDMWRMPDQDEVFSLC
jgi:hypothetical protein